MWDADRPADHIGDGEHFEELVGIDAHFVAFFEVVLDAVITAQYHRGDEPQHFLGTRVESALLVGLVIEAPEAFDDLVVVGEDALVHAGAVVVEFLNSVHISEFYVAK
jgi:hypothetical protein